jgi:hypothetical protein
LNGIEQSGSQLLNTNTQNNFFVSFAKRPELDYGAVGVTQPGISTEARKISILAKLIPVPNRSMDPVREQLVVRFNCSEDMSNYYGVFKWIKDYTDMTVRNDDLVSDVVIIQYDLSKRPRRKILLSNAFPVSLSSLDLATSDSSANPLTFTASFEMTEIEIEEF